MVAFLLVACGGGGGGGGGGDEAGGRTGDSLRIAVGEDIWPLTGVGPSSKHFAAGELSVGVYEPLLRLGTDFTVQPGLAERWEPVDPQRWRFHLRQQVRFHDGRNFGADDVVWSWTGRQFLPGAVEGVLDSVVKVDEHTVDFVLRTPDNRLPEKLVHPEGPIVPRNGHNDATPPAGTGPYKVVEYRPSQRVVVERYEEYWGEKPKVRRLTFLFTPDPAERVEFLTSGDVDVATNVPWESVAQVEAKSGFRVAKAPVGATQTLSFNSMGVPPAREVRRAVALSLDRAAYVAEVLKGNGEPGRWMAPGPVLGPSASVVGAPPFDVAEARRVLDDAGWRPGADGVRAREGQRLTLTLVGGQSVPEAGLRFVQAKLKDVGIEVAMKYGQSIATYQEFRQKGFDLDLGMPNQNNADPSFLVTGRASAAQTAAVQTAPNREAVQLISAELMRTFVGEEFVAIPLAHVSRLYGLRPGVDLTNLHPSAINQSWVGLSAG
ncbi:MAG: ABC transporter substrate-binding protein [Acidimicrobiales bacterium]